MMQVSLTLKSENRKTGPIPVSTTSEETCPPSCGLFKTCYAKLGEIKFHWRKVSDGERGVDWSEFLEQIRRLPAGQLWRHNQAGDLPGLGDKLDVKALAGLVKANRGRRGFTYTHKPLTTAAERNAVASANRNGFAVNLSADSLDDADRLAELKIGPAVVVLPSWQRTNTQTPAGRNVVVCPAYTRDLTCANCQLCQRQTRAIVGFPAHGMLADKIDQRIALDTLFGPVT